MLQNVDYEVPYLRKQAAKYNQLITDADRKHAEYLKSASTCASTFKKVTNTGHTETAQYTQPGRCLLVGITFCLQVLW